MQSNFTSSILISSLLLTPFLTKAQTTWEVDPTHSSIQFSVNHLVISEVTGQFKSFRGSVVMDGEDFATAQVEGEIRVNSIDTGNGQRDSHLKAPDFFDASSYPSISFESKEVTIKSNSSYVIIGDLTMKGVTKKIVLEVKYKGAVSFMGQTKSGLKATTTINRFDYDLNWNAMLEAGGAVVGKDVTITLNLELVRKT